MVNIKTAAKMLGYSPAHVRKLCRDKKLSAEWVKDTSSNGGHWEPVAESVSALAKENGIDDVNKEIADHQKEQRRAASEFDVEKLIDDLGLNKEQGNRLRASSAIPKKQAEAILKAEQAFERQNKNMLQSKNIVSLEDLQEQHDRIYAVQFQNLKDMVESFITKFRLMPGQAAEARVDFENVMRRTCDELRSISR